MIIPLSGKNVICFFKNTCIKVTVQPAGPKSEAELLRIKTKKLIVESIHGQNKKKGDCSMADMVKTSGKERMDDGREYACQEKNCVNWCGNL